MSGANGCRPPIRRALCVRLDGLGDLLMTTPALRALAEGGAEVTLLVSPAGAEAARLVPEVAEVIPYDAPWMKATTRAPGCDDRVLVDRLARGRFDAAFVFSLHSQSPLPAATVCALAGIPRRVARCRENPYRLLTLWLREDETDQPFRHDVERQLALVEAAGFRPSHDRLSLAVPAAARAEARAMLAGLGLRAQHWCLLHPGATAESRRYPAAAFAEAARILARGGTPVVVVGGPGDGGRVDAIVRGGGAGLHRLPGPPSLPVLAALIAEAPVLVANNSGPAHVAAAVGTPVVDLYALTNPQHAPWRVPHRLLFEDVSCRFCYRSVCPEGHHRCLRGVAPARVAAAALELLHSSMPEEVVL